MVFLISGVEGIWRGGIFVPYGLSTGPHKFPAFDEAMLAPKEALSFSPATAVRRGEERQPTRSVLHRCCIGVGSEHYGWRPECR